ncbi:MAG: MmcQ/YjbR family DNA-binding protein [Planctomycetes bacterium]|nr:MmcQ/YjbR family DNA-binding protein [Planctomycetota bacterium]MCB9905518.1 MmcQ/YjbR family DNA-binding protein [Planctomycetota bacterium]
MLADDFRRLALALPETEEREHHDHPDFRVGGKVFATLGPDGEWAMLKLTPEAQARCVDARPKVFEAFPGAWGKQGCTRVWLAKAKEADVSKLVETAWRRTAPKRLSEGRHD